MTSERDAAAEAARLEAIATLETRLLEQVSNLADVGLAMKNALEDRGFSSMVAEPAAIQYMWGAGPQFVAGRDALG